jgi:hypothetical protein
LLQHLPTLSSPTLLGREPSWLWKEFTGTRAVGGGGEDRGSISVEDVSAEVQAAARNLGSEIILLKQGRCPLGAGESVCSHYGSADRSLDNVSYERSGFTRSRFAKVNMVMICPQRQSRKEAYSRKCLLSWGYKDMQQQNQKVLTSPNDFAIITDGDIQRRPSPNFYLFRLPSKVNTIEDRWNERLDDRPNR